MKSHAAIGLTVLAGFALCADAIHGLRAEEKPPVYLIAEVNVTDIDGYMKEYAPKAQASLQTFGGRILAATENVTAIEGTPPSRRVVVMVWDSQAQILAWRESAEYKEDRKVGDKYATFRMFAVEGLPRAP